MNNNALTWLDGYVADIAYDYSFFPEIAPMSMVLNLLNRHALPPSLDKFTYCELGCGQGFTTNLLAATHPQGEFWGVDFNPSHITAAQQLTTAAELINIQFQDQSFAEFLATDTPKFDFITLHGVYAWVGDANRQTIVELLRQKLNCGGAVYISYNSLPGWSALMPLRELLVRSPQQATNSSLEKVEQGLQFAQSLQDLQARYFVENPSAQRELAEMQEDSRTYLAHEYFNQDWRPLYHAEVVEQLATAKLTFASSADLDDEFYNLKLKDEQLDFLAQISDRTLQETTRDFFFNSRFRRDLFVRGAVSMPALEQAEYLSTIRFALTILPEEMDYEVELVGRSLKLDAAIYQPLVAVLAQQPQTLRELMQQPMLKTLDFAALWQALKILISIERVAPALTQQDSERCQPVVARLNTALLKRSRFGADTQVLASPVTGGGIPISRSEQLFLLAQQRNVDPIQFIHKIVQAQGERLMKDGQVLESPEAIQAELERQVERIKVSRLPLFEQLGLVE
ncbi:MAG: methyltransferase domain-containing protein [Spirulina sp. SIO3F2]|nr:methyltransferase domain-containing protein [Spirulina sp. SIO3F2]